MVRLHCGGRRDTLLELSISRIIYGISVIFGSFFRLKGGSGVFYIGLVGNALMG
jgi:hypothetical protein